MEARDWTGTVFCPKCRKDISKPNYYLHEVRCKGPSKLYESRVMQASSIKYENRMAGGPSAPYAVPIPPPSSGSSQIRGLASSMLRYEEKVVCGQCGFRLTFAELDTHDEKCYGKLARCYYCNMQFPPVVLEDHHAVCEGKKYLMRLSELNERYSSGRRSNSSSYHSFDSDREDPPYPQHRYRYPRQMMSPSHLLLNLLSLNRHHDMEHIFTNLFRNLRIQQGYPGLNREQLNQILTTKYRKKPEEELCTICYCNMEYDEVVCYLRCTHTYHADCVKKWLEKNGKCPVCKQNAM